MAFLKPCKNSALGESYRVGVLSEKKRNRIEWVVENKKFISDYQMGFRRGVVVNNSIACLTTFIQTTFIQDQTVIAVVLDIKTAYDNVDVSML